MKIAISCQEEGIESIIDQGFPVLLKPIQPAKFRAMLSHLIQA
mgnify:CR=1 FL=1